MGNYLEMPMLFAVARRLSGRGKPMTALGGTAGTAAPPAGPETFFPGIPGSLIAAGIPCRGEKGGEKEKDEKPRKKWFTIGLKYSIMYTFTAGGNVTPHRVGNYAVSQPQSCKRSQVVHICAGAFVRYSPSMRTNATVQRCAACERLRGNYFVQAVRFNGQGSAAGGSGPAGLPANDLRIFPGVHRCRPVKVPVVQRG